MRYASLLPIVLSMSFGLPAQQMTSGTATVLTLPNLGEGCPVGVGAQLDGRAVMRTAGDAKAKVDSPLLQLSFDRQDQPRIVGARVTVHGVVPTSRLLPAAEHDDANRTQSFDLDRLSAKRQDVVEREVSVTRMTFVRWVDVTELRYADGSTWHASKEAQCRAVPSGFRLVDLAAK